VGAGLALSGALIQGVFRNGLAAPSVIGVTGGATLGASLAILVLSGYGSATIRLQDIVKDIGGATFVIPLFGFVGALAVVLLVMMLSTSGGRISVPTLLLSGIAVNTCISGLLAVISSQIMGDWEVARTVLAWAFGTFDDRSGYHAATVWSGIGMALLVVPFVAWELDLLQSGEEDAAALGVHTGRVRLLTIMAASLAAASAVAVAGQISFVGLIVPHLVRMLAGKRHAALIPLSLLFGAVFLVAVDLGMRRVFGDPSPIQPGVAMSVVGGPFFLLLLLWHRRELDTW
jgi:iron complex transport system permease protein